MERRKGKCNMCLRWTGIKNDMERLLELLEYSEHYQLDVDQIDEIKTIQKRWGLYNGKEYDD